MGLHKFKTKKRIFHYDGKCLGCPKKITQSSDKSLKAEAVQATGEWMFSSASTGWRQLDTLHQTPILLLSAQLNLDAQEIGPKNI